jgi:hypothetical protein
VAAALSRRREQPAIIGTVISSTSAVLSQTAPVDLHCTTRGLLVAYPRSHSLTRSDGGIGSSAGGPVVSRMADIARVVGVGLTA